jgi:drug/metabolite transporter (DMT)-like permease
MTAVSEATFHPPRRLYAMLLMIISSTVISFSGLIIRNMESADAWHVNFYRTLAFGAAVGIVLLFRYGKKAPQKIIGIGKLGFFGGFLLAIGGMAFMQAITNTTVATTLFMMSGIPFFTAAIAWLVLGETIGRFTILIMLAASVGILLMVIEGFGSGSLYGNFMALLCAVSFSFYATILRRNRAVEMLPVLIVSSLIIIIAALIMRWDSMAISFNDMALCFLLGGIVSGSANMMFVSASKHLLGGELTFFMLLEFTLGPIWVWIFINEVPTGWTIIGGSVVISAVLLHAVLELNKDRQKAARKLKKL